MFFTYLWRELRRRLRQAVLIALGLALGVGRPARPLELVAVPG
jgi:hypothetical protein